MEGYRKFFAFLVYEGVMLIAFALVIITGHLTDALFTAWGVAAGGGLVTFTGGNVISNIKGKQE